MNNSPGIMHIMEDLEPLPALHEASQTHPVDEASATPSTKKKEVDLQWGKDIDFLNIEDQLVEARGMIVDVQRLEKDGAGHCVILVNGHRCIYVVIHKDDWMRMASTVECVDSHDVMAARSYFYNSDVEYLAVASHKYGGKKGVSPRYAANRLWKPVTGSTVKKHLFR